MASIFTTRTAPSSRSSFQPIVFLGLFACLAGCRGLAGYDGNATFEQPQDGSTGGGGEEPDAIDEDQSIDAESGAADVMSDGDSSDREAMSIDGSRSDAAADVEVSDAHDGAPIADSGPDGMMDAAVEAEADGEMGDASCDPQPPKSGTNVITNADFESTTSPGAGWSGGYGAAFSVSSTHSHCGGHAGAITGRSAFYHCFSYAAALPEGSTYSYSAWVYQDGANPIMMAVQWYTSNTTCPMGMFGPVSYTSVPPKTWIRLSGNLTIPTGCATSALYIVQQDPGPSPSDSGPPFPDLYADDVYLIP